MEITKVTNLVLNERTQHYQVIGPVGPADVVAEAKRLLWGCMQRDDLVPLTSPDGVRDYLRLQLAHQEREVFAVLFLDTHHRAISYEELFFGTIDGARVHPREVVKVALRQNAAAVILSHNHPSGVAEPSEADRRITQRLKDALALVDVRVLDHFVVGVEGSVSFAERGGYCKLSYPPHRGGNSNK
jgi:DNA repair protein RadC